MRLRLLALVSPLLFSITAAQAQRMGGTQADSKMLPGGSAGGGGLSGLYSPNLFDGSATVNIPIYQYNAEDGDYGVGLSFSTKGIKVDQHGSAAGTGAEIFCGPTLVRVIKGLPDELNADLDTLQTAPVYDNDPGGDQFTLNHDFWVKGKFATYSESPTSQGYSNIYRDGEADDFIVTLGGSSFTFNLGKDNYIFTRPRRGVKIELLLNGNTLTSIADFQEVGKLQSQKLEFRITDENGTEYLFIQGDYELKTLEDEFGLGYNLLDYWVTTRWVIKEVLFAGGSKITYTYDHIDRTGSATPAYISYSSKEGGPSLLNPPTSKQEQTFSPHFAIPASIAYPNGVTLQFQYDAQRRSDYHYGALRSIQVSGPHSCLSYKLMQSFWKATSAIEIPYAQGVGSADPDTRLRLDSIMTASCDGTVTEPLYRFSYSTVALPKRLSVSQDYFGYYNAATYVGYPSGSPNSIPSHQAWGSTSVYGISRDPNPNVLEAGLLRSVKNAYGGEIRFYYSPHQLGTGSGVNVIDDYLSLPADADFMGKNADDGLRLDSVVEKEQYHAGNSRVTRFQYSGGQRFLVGGYFYSPLAWKVISNELRPYTIIYTNNSITPHHLVGGSNHGYSNVTVETLTGTGELLGRTEYVFTNFKDASSSNVPRYTVTGTGKHYFQYPFTDKQFVREWELSLPLEVTEYDNHNQVISKTINTYNFITDSTSSQGKVENCKAGRMLLWDQPLPDAPTQSVSRDSLDYYRPYRGWAQLASSVTLKYLSSSQYVADTATFAYNSRGKLAEVLTSNSRRQKTRTKTIYNYDVETQNPAQVIHQMNQSGYEKVVGTERWLLGATGMFSDRLLDATISTYTLLNGKPLAKALYALETAAPIPYSTYTGYSGGPYVPPPYQNFHTAFSGGAVTYFQKTSEVQQYDGTGNPTESYLPLSGQYKAMIWDTVSNKKLAEAGCRLADMGYSGFDSYHQGGFSYPAAGAVWVADAPAGRNAFNFGSGSISRSGLTAGKKYHLSLWCTTAPTCTIGGTAVPLTAGQQVGNWTYYEAVFTPATGGALLSLSAPANRYLDELRLYPDGTGLQCWTHDVLFGIKAASSPTGRLSTYEYDKLGRQNLVRDQDRTILSKTEFHIGQ